MTDERIDFYAHEIGGVDHERPESFDADRAIIRRAVNEAEQGVRVRLDQQFAVARAAVAIEREACARIAERCATRYVDIRVKAPFLAMADEIRIRGHGEEGM